MIIPNDPTGKVNLKEEALMMLSMMQATGQKYSANYLIRLLKGDDRYEPRDPAHLEVTGYGALPEAYPDQLRNLLRYFQREGLIEPQNSMYGILTLTPQGEQFLAEPTDLWATYRSLRLQEFELRLLMELRDLRRNLAQQEGKAPFRIFTDYMLQRLIEEEPRTATDLQMIPGFGPYKANRYGPPVLQVINHVHQQKEEAKRLQLAKKVHNSSHQAVKAMFEAGLSEVEIAEKRRIKPATVRSMLLNLHRAKEINLTPWIEQELDQATLEKGAAYFRQHQNPRLKAAYETLGLDYDVLRLCRLYVAEVSSKQEELEVA